MINVTRYYLLKTFVERRGMTQHIFGASASLISKTSYSPVIQTIELFMTRVQSVHTLLMYPREWLNL